MTNRPERLWGNNPLEEAESPEPMTRLEGILDKMKQPQTI